MPRTSKKITTQKIVPQALTPKVVKARPMIQFGTGSSRGCFGESVTCEKVASLILTCPDIQAAINAVSSPDIFIVSVVPTALPGVFTANLSDGTSFTIDLSSLVENQTLSLSNGLLTISEGNTIDLCPVIAYCITNNGLPAGVDLFTLNGTTITTGSTHNLTLDSNANTIELEVDGVTVSTAPIVNSNTIDTVGNTITSTVNGISDTAPIINSVANTVDVNGDLITTVNGVPSSPLDLGSILDIDDQQLSSAGNTMSLTNGGTAPIVNSITSSTDVNGDLIVTVNGISSAPIDINPDCADVIACVESEPNLNLQDVSTNNLTVAGDLSIPASEISLTTSANTATLTLGNQTVNAPIINSNVQTLSGTTLTSTVNGIPAPVDLAPLMNSAVFQSNDDQVLTAGATSDMNVQLVPTTVTDPDSQTDKVNYEISVTPKTTVICSGNPLSATNKLLTSDIWTTNTTPPANLGAGPNPADPNIEFIPVHKTNNVCTESLAVPAQRMVTRQALTPTAIVTANPLAPNLINSGGKDLYTSSVGYTITIPSGGNYYYDFDDRSATFINQPNTDGNVQNVPFDSGSYYMTVETDNYSKEQNFIIVDHAGVSKSKSPIVGGTIISILRDTRVRVDTGIAPVMSGGSFSFNVFDNIITFYPTN